MNDTKTYYSIIIVKPNKQSITLRLRKTFLLGFLSFLFMGSLIIAIYTYISLHSSIQLSDYDTLKNKTITQADSLELQNHRLNELEIELESLIEKEEEIRLLLGDTTPTSTKYRKYKNRKKKNNSLIFRKAFTDISTQETTKTELIEAKIAFLKENIAQSLISYNEILERANHFKIRFAFTPSIWPVYGAVRSRYGLRIHPIKGTKIFHNGLDIAAWEGAPIQATAEGIVEFSGWSTSYGFVVVLNHDFGYRTIYAHCSKLLVSKNDYIKKGQIIAQIGSTGLSTGPHLHYEVKKWKKSLNPNPFLGLDMFTASTEIW